MKAPIKVNLKTLAGLRASSKDEFYWDADLKGFGVKVMSGSAKSPPGAIVYVYQYRVGGRSASSRRYTIGRHGSPWTPSSARDQAERLAIMVAQGTDPLDADRKRMREATDLAFDRYIRTFHDEYLVERWKDATKSLRSLEMHAAPILKNKPINAISKSDLHKIYAAIPGVAQRKNVHDVLRKMFRWAVNKGDLEASPLSGFEAPPSAKARTRVLNEEEIICFWLASFNVGSVFGRPYRLLLATAQRKEEVSGLPWQELNQAAKRWDLPEARAKNHHANKVHLNRHAVIELDEMAMEQGAPVREGKVIWPKHGLVFTTTGNTSISGWGNAKERITKEMLKIAKHRAKERGDSATHVNIPSWVNHDLRRSAATMFQKMGVGLQVTEAVLNHVAGSRAGIVGVYQRHDYWSEKVAAWEDWANAIDRLLDTPVTAADNVVQLAARA